MPVIDSIGKNDLTYDEEYAIRSYVSSESYKINDKLRNNIKLNEQDNILIKNLDSALEKCYNYNGLISRTLKIPENELEKYLNKNKIGDKVIYNEYLSFSNKAGYNNNANVIIYVNSSKGKDVIKYNPSESEIIYKRNSKFKVENMVRINGVYYMEWSELNENE
ncbi:MAG: ADP-ribosyltransferase [Clostridia bacterium]